MFVVYITGSPIEYFDCNLDLWCQLWERYLGCNESVWMIPGTISD